jgi:hypothetical protein
VGPCLSLFRLRPPELAPKGLLSKWELRRLRVKRVDRSSRQGRWVIPRDRPSVSLCFLIGSFVPDRVAGCSVHLRRHRATTVRRRLG